MDADGPVAGITMDGKVFFEVSVGWGIFGDEVCNLCGGGLGRDGRRD